MNKIVTLVFAATFAFAMTTPLQAMTAPPLGHGAMTKVEQIAGGCGRGMHRGTYGKCRQNWADPDKHPCPRGYHVGPHGGCRGNGR
jgi:hypothetical protein